MVEAYYYSERFQLAAQVPSPSDTRTEIDLKTYRYCEAPGNLYAVVIDPGKYMAEIYARTCKWKPVVLERPDDVIEMPELACAAWWPTSTSARRSTRE
jgi:hypothetical protein